MKKTAKEVDKYTLDFLDKLKKENEDIPYEAVAHLPKLRMSLHGVPKIRSTFGRLLFELIDPNNDWKQILPILSAIEIYGISTYVLDDIFDNQPIRQNDLATWKKYGLNNAIISGILQRDISVKILLQLDTSKDKLFEIVKIFEQADYSLYIGQYLNEKMTSKIKEEDYVKRCTFLTCENPAMARMIGIICNLDDKELDIIEVFGRKFGTIAMMRNDFMNLVPEEIKTKTATSALKEKTFEDLRKGLWTYPIIHFLTKSSAKQEDKNFLLKSVLGNWEATEDELLKTIKLLIKYNSIKSFVDFILKYKKEIIDYINNNFNNKEGIKKFDSFFQLFENVKVYNKLMEENFS